MGIISKFKEFKEPEMVSLIVGIGSGSKVYQSFLDGHPALYIIPGYSLMYYYPHWNQWKEEGKTSSWNSIVDAFCQNHPSVIDTRKMPGSETLNQLGESQNEWVDIGEEKFKNIILKILEEEPISSRSFLLAIHYAYSLCLNEDISIKQIILYHIHVPFYVDQYLAPDFPDLKVIMMSRDPRGNLDRRVKNSMFKADLPKMRESDFLLFKRRAYWNMIKIVLEGFDTIRKPNFLNLRVVKHEDLVTRLNSVMDNSASFLDIEKDPKLYTTTFASKVWRTKFYEISKEFQVNPEILSLEWKNTISPIEWFVLEGLTYDKLIKYGYKPEKYINDSYINRLKLLIYILIPTSREIEEFMNLLSISKLIYFIKKVNYESQNFNLLKEYKNNAYYRHKWTNEGLNLDKEPFYVYKLRGILRSNDESFRRFWFSKLYLLIYSLKYLYAILSYPIEILKRIKISYKAFQRRIADLQILPELL